MTILSDELANDPLSRGYDGMTDEQVAQSLNAVDRTRPKTTYWSDINLYLVMNDLRSEVRAAAALDGVDSEVCDSIMDRVRYCPEKPITIHGEDGNVHPVTNQIFDVLVASSKVPSFNSTRKAEIIAIGLEPCSRAQELKIRVTAGHVQAERAS